MRHQLAKLANRCAPTLTIATLVIAWEALCRVNGIPPFVLPAPTVILGSLGDLEWRLWLEHLGATVYVALVGYVASIVISLPIAIALASSSLLSRTVFPLLVVVNTTPIVAIAPIIIVTLGPSDISRIVITFLITFFPIAVATVVGLLATPSEQVELSRSLRASTWRQMVDIRLPFAVPYIFSALKVSTTLAVIGAVVAEFVAAEKGLGYLTFYSTSFFKVPQAFAALTILVTIGLVMFNIVTAAQRILFPWSLGEIDTAAKR